ncbi:protein of unknown function [Methylorubrum extorquens DM4]|uniref:Uncharacterized protein n=1 Tax=Methylorubrum extorquens (strain DSM 6343 / CIP 106787 / DM4) TaxID=661410 RepID=C7CFJ4_METED|nr:protein of unknown function [Methylorubrum extorquens DM4]
MGHNHGVLTEPAHGELHLARRRVREAEISLSLHDAQAIAEGIERSQAASQAHIAQPRSLIAHPL